jgi:Holin of 3TMs, for gene-transfer release
MAEEIREMSDSEKKKEDWMNSKWRPMMGWMYMAVCMADFILFPILWSIIQVHGGGEVKMQWQPITLQGAGLFHIAMGAVLGIAAYGRTQEKMNGANNGGIQLPSNAGTTYIPPSATTTANINVGNAPVTAPSYAAPRPTYTPSYSAPSTAVGMSSTGKPMPAPQIDEPL